MRKISAILLLLCLLTATASPAQGLSGCEITIPKIGKADAILISSAWGAVLIDAGEEDDGEEILDLLAARGITSLAALVITHYDKDHIGGAPEVLAAIPVERIYQPDATGEDSDAFEAYSRALAALDGEIVTVRQDQAMSFGPDTLELRVLPTALSDPDDNERSLIVSLTDGYHSFLFMGDATGRRIEEAIAGGLLHHTFLKVPHHGRWDDALEYLLQAVTPNLAVITDSDKNPAEGETLALFQTHRAIDLYETRFGDIRVVSGASGLEVYQ